ncbi:MAG: radical SAM peptide maturase, CXXX-repeat target family [Paludibacteraceae bacterium]|nr:radical SAM peptide maturase, CXXX-repeat target family [Paludibacteraceae bacterium]
MEKIYKTQEESWKCGIAKSITFIVTKDCQLACKYCYLVGKNLNERMSWEVAKQAIDYILAHEQNFKEESVIWDFIGGEPFLEIDLIDQICDYIKSELFRRNHHWFNSYRFNFSTNGINYDSEKVQRFIEKNKSHLSIGITIDGTRRKHDLNRVYKGTEKGSYDDVVRNIPLWQSQFPRVATKVTISSADLSYVCESVQHLYSLGIHEVNINVVFEDVWNEGDDCIFEKQLLHLADWIIDGDYFKEYACSFFMENIGKPLDSKLENNNWCGAGKMLSIDAAGNFYPCTRFAQYSLRDKEAWIIGNIHDGIDNNKLRPFLTLDRCTQSNPECFDCEVAEGCAWCQGENYDAAKTHTVFQRATAICKMHKARVRANNYYWNKLYRKLEMEDKREEFEQSQKQKVESQKSQIC